MTGQEDGEKEESASKERQPTLASKSTKGLLGSLLEHEDHSASTPESATPSKPGGRGAARGIFSSRSGSPIAAELNPLKTNLSKFLTWSRTFSRLRDLREELSRVTPSAPAHAFRDGFNLPLIGEVKPRYLWGLAKDWLRSPKNWALLIWGIAVGISGAILFMVMVGMLNAVIPDRSSRHAWFEVSNQIINALFTLMVVYLHPQRCLHLYMLWRWKASDIVKLRNIYCKNGTRKPHEWGHMLVVVMLLQLNCFAQYALCGLNWGFSRAQRPSIFVGLTLCLSLGGAAGAGIYNTVSPLGKDFEVESEGPSDLEKTTVAQHEPQFTPRTRIYRMLERTVSFVRRDEGVLVDNPEWKGGLFDVTNEPPVSILSVFCGLCVFGWNMERLSFGNRYVHIVTFVLILTSPFWIFDVAALNIENWYVRHSISGTGIALCAFGLLYGGYWRMRMRERFNLPSDRTCCGRPGATDCFKWLFCPLCSLCQEVRTAESYDVKDNRFYSRSHLGPPSCPPPGLASPHSPGPTLPDFNLMNLMDVEFMGHESPYREYTPHMSPQAPPTRQTATRSTNGLPGGSPQRPSPSSPSSKNPFLDLGASPSTNPFIQSAPPNESPACTSTTTSPLLQPEVCSRGACSPLHSPQYSSSNPFTQAELSAQASDAIMRSPIRSPHLLSTSTNTFTPPEASSPATEMRTSPLQRASPSQKPFYSPEMSCTAAAEQNPQQGMSTSPASSNPFL